MKKYKFVYICSPCKGHDGNREHNITMAQEYCRLTMELWPGIIPIAPHVYFTQFLSDTDKLERRMGMAGGIALLSLCSEIWVFGIDNPSEGMKNEIRYAEDHDIKIVDARDVFRANTPTLMPAAGAASMEAMMPASVSPTLRQSWHDPVINVGEIKLDAIDPAAGPQDPAHALVEQIQKIAGNVTNALRGQGYDV